MASRSGFDLWSFVGGFSLMDLVARCGFGNHLNGAMNNTLFKNTFRTWNSRQIMEDKRNGTSLESKVQAAQLSLTITQGSGTGAATQLVTQPSSFSSLESKV
jgi:hypothetical protein